MNISHEDETSTIMDHHDETSRSRYALSDKSNHPLIINHINHQPTTSDETPLQQLRLSNHGSATTLQQPKLTLASATTLQQPKPTLASPTKPQQPKLAYQNPTPSGKYMQSHILHVISKSHPLWQIYARSHLTRHVMWFSNHSLRSIVYASWFTEHSLRVMVYRSSGYESDLTATSL